jgi:hypothetical protein
VLDPLVHAIDASYGTGVAIHGRLRDDRTELEFHALSAESPAEARAGSTAGARGGILAIVAVDADGGLLERGGSAEPDARTAMDVARALEIVRRRAGLASYSLELGLTRGGAVVRASRDVSLLVVLERGVDPARVLQLAPDPRSYLRDGRERSKDAIDLTEALLRGSGARPEPAARVPPPEPTPRRPRVIHFGFGGPIDRARSAVEEKVQSVMEPIGWLLGRARDAGRSVVDVRSKPAHVTNGASKNGGGSHSVPAPAVNGHAHAMHPAPSRTASPPTAVPSNGRAASAVARDPGLEKREVEEATTGLLRAAEEYLGPRMLDRIIKETSPDAWRWENRRVSVRSERDDLDVARVEEVYRELRNVFARGGAFSDALRSFDFEAWMSQLPFDHPHAAVARAVLGARAGA